MGKKNKIGIDYGGTKIEGILLNENSHKIKRKRYSYKKNYISGIETVKKLVNEFDKISGHKCSVGIGIPVLINEYSIEGRISNISNTFFNG